MTGKSFWKAGQVAVSMCLLIQSSLWAQAAAGSAAGSIGVSNNGSIMVAPTAAKAHDDSFVIGNDVVLAINVWKEPDISQKTVSVRSDGKISLPLVGEVQAAGLTPLKLEKDIAGKLKTVRNAKIVVYGYTVAQTMVQVLKQCGDNLTRENVMKQAASLDLELGMLRPGIKITTSPADYQPIKQLFLIQFDGRDWVPIGKAAGN